MKREVNLDDDLASCAEIEAKITAADMRGAVELVIAGGDALDHVLKDSRCGYPPLAWWTAAGHVQCGVAAAIEKLQAGKHDGAGTIAEALCGLEEWLARIDDDQKESGEDKRGWKRFADEWPRLRIALRSFLVASPPAAAGGIPGESEVNDGNGSASEHEKSPPSSTPELVLRRLQPAVRKAYLAYQYAVTMNRKQLEDRAAFDWLNEHGIETDQGDLGELADYKMPALDTWARQVRDARKALGEQKYTPRAGRANGKRSIVAKADI